LTVVTHNTKHFSRIEGIKVEDWTLWVLFPDFQVARQGDKE
jgi:hypothetical protein